MADQSAYDMKIVRVIAQALRQLSLPPVTRPPLGPNDPATEGLVRSTLTYHVYSQIAHTRHILAGFLSLVDIKNVSSAWILSRHVFESTGMACYLAQNLKGLMSQRMWQQAFGLLFKATTGNQWVKNHGSTYETFPFPDEIEGPIGTNNLTAAYAKYQKTTYGKSTAFDTYSLLSEHSHPGAACLECHRHWVGGIGLTTEPRTESTFGGTKAFAIDWLIVTHELLGMANEETVRNQLVTIVQAVAQIATTKEQNDPTVNEI
jgi:hypothetical protein